MGSCALVIGPFGRVEWSTRTEEYVFRQQEAVQPQPALDLLTAIGGTKSLSILDGFAGRFGSTGGRGGSPTSRRAPFGGDRGAPARGAGDRPVAVRAPQVRRRPLAAGRLSHFPPKRKAARSPNRRASIERRRTLAASGPMPPQLASQFTTGELAALRIVADAVRERGACILTLGEIAARAGVCVTTARNALRTAAREGLVTIEERRRDKRPNLANVVRVVSREWKTWIERGPKGKRARTPRRGRGGRVQKNRGHGQRFFQKLTRRPRFTRSTFPKCPSQDAKRRLARGHRLYAASPRRGSSMKSGAARFGKTNSGEEA